MPATLEMVVWDNGSGLYPTWTEAEPAWRSGLISAGVSGTFNLSSLAGPTGLPPNLYGLQSFNTYFIPEPASFGLAGLGAVTMWILHRRKNRVGSERFAKVYLSAFTVTERNRSDTDRLGK